MAQITVDGEVIEVAAGRTILQALDDAGLLMNGVDVPHYCWHPKLTIDGSCRLCQVEVEGIPKLQIACNTPVKDGMVVHTKTERVKRAREGVMELLLINHPLDCPICDQAGECKLQDYAYEYGVPHSRTKEPRRAAKKRVDLGPTIVFDQERCILCRRCVRFCREVPGTGELAVFERGDRSVIETFPGTALDNPYSMNVADICPVGALTTKDFRFKIRVWFLTDVPGVCTGCSNGCNVHLGVANNKVYRYLPRRNDAVNDTWICDAGRMSYAEIGAESRLKNAYLRNERGVLETAAYKSAIERAAARLRALLEAKGPGVIAALASPHATNEDLLTLRRLLDAAGVQNAGVAVPHWQPDALLVKAERAANAEGARALGFPDAHVVLDRVRAGGVDALLVLGHDVLDPAYLGDPAALASLDTVIVLDTHRSELERVAHVLLPVRVAAEKHGTLTNHAGRVQRVRPAVEPAFEAYAEGEVLARLGALLQLPGFDGKWDVRETSRALGTSSPAFVGVDVESVGEQGRPLATVVAGASGTGGRA
ncbi:MAG TPA: 2Fe-2S iron-sulfur cluster-binding protein [Myxococcota bacterium]|jgi:NADH-quinone oxidoreductase subunit G|nr:2Fe-2S iron-sulfur cluster-binding protein [Myxococcota bacterium]